LNGRFAEFAAMLSEHAGQLDRDALEFAVFLSTETTEKGAAVDRTQLCIPVRKPRRAAGHVRPQIAAR
jgi:hypothetical protein